LQMDRLIASLTKVQALSFKMFIQSTWYDLFLFATYLPFYQMFFCRDLGCYDGKRWLFSKLHFSFLIRHELILWYLFSFLHYLVWRWCPSRCFQNARRSGKVKRLFNVCCGVILTDEPSCFN
jgi:hypothetical protein